MIRLEQPSIALIDFRAPGRFHMWRTHKISSIETTRQTIIDLGLRYANAAPSGTRIKNLVILCHGYPAYLQLGEGFWEQHLPMFSAWRGRFEAIWIEACLVARPDDQPFKHKGVTYAADGQGFCSRLAHITEADVVASSEINHVNARMYPYGYISDLEGRVTLFQAGTGRPIAWTQNRSSRQDSSGRWHGAAESS